MSFDFRSELEHKVGSITDDEYRAVKKMAIDDLVRNEKFRLIEVETALAPDAEVEGLSDVRQELLESGEIALRIYRKHGPRSTES